MNERFDRESESTGSSNPYSPPVSEDRLRDAMEYRDYFEDDAEFQDALAIWPVCPKCGRRRITRCPICKTVGNLFPLADADYWVETEASDSAVVAKSSCSCGGRSHSCRSSEETSSCRSNVDDNSRRSEADAPVRSNSDADDDSTNVPSLPPLEILGQYMPSGAKSGETESPSDSSDSSDSSNRDKPFPDTLDGQLMPGVRDWRKGNYSLVEVSPEQKIISVENEQYCKTQSPPDRNALESQDGELKLAICYVCSESFKPKFPAKCEWCDHEFEDSDDDSFESKKTSESAESNEVSALATNDSDDAPRLQRLLREEDEINPKAIFVLLTLGVLFLLAALYFWFIF